MTLNGDSKSKGKLSRDLKCDISNLVIFHGSCRKAENLYFDGLLLSKAYNILDKKVQKSYVSWNWRVMESLKKNWLLIPKMTWGIWWILMQAVVSLKIYTLMCYFCRKYIIFDPKKYRAVMCHNTEEWCKIWGGTDLCLENDMRNLVNFELTLESLKICTLMGSFWLKYLMFEL